MVRTLDPEKSDISNLIRSYLNKFNPFSSGNQKLALKQQKLVLGLLLAQEKYQKILRDLKDKSGKDLTIKFKSDCSDGFRYGPNHKKYAIYKGESDPET